MLFLSIFGTGERVDVEELAECEDEVEIRGGDRLVTGTFAGSETTFWAATEPKDLRPPADRTAGVGAGEGGTGVEPSYIEPKVTADPGQDTEVG